LLCLPAKLAASLGNIGPVVVVTRVTNAITLTDPLTLRQAVLEANAFWRTPLRPIMTSRQLSEFYILDAEVVEPTGGCGCGRAVFLCVSRCQRVCVYWRAQCSHCAACVHVLACLSIV
jgi:nonsense-mediated mRNA decay protein 3